MEGHGSTFVGLLPKVHTSDLIVGKDQIQGEGFSKESMSILFTGVKAVTDKTVGLSQMEGDWGCGGGGKVRVAIKCRWDSRQILGRKGT